MEMVKDFLILKSLDVSKNNLGAENALTVGLKVPPEVETVVLCNTPVLQNIPSLSRFTRCASKTVLVWVQTVGQDLFSGTIEMSLKN